MWWYDGQPSKTVYTTDKVVAVAAYGWTFGEEFEYCQDDIYYYDCTNGKRGKKMTFPGQLVAAKADGLAIVSVSFYCEFAGKFYECEPNSRVMGKQIYIPKNFELVAVSSFGKYFARTTFYCKGLLDGNYYTCNVGKNPEWAFSGGRELVDAAAYGKYVSIERLHFR